MADYESEQIIIKYLTEHKRASVSELAKILYVSEATVRRKLTDLEFKRQVRRTHGGAVLVNEGEETSTTIRETANAKEKNEIARMAIDRLPSFYSLFMDNSSTALSLLKILDLEGKLFITNGFQAMTIAASNPKTQVFIPAGQLKLDIGGICGSKVISDLQNYIFDIAIFSCTSVSANGVFEPNDNTAAIKRAAMKRAKFKVLLFDSSKLNKNGYFRSCDINDFDLVVTQARKDEIKDLLKIKPDIICKP